MIATPLARGTESGLQACSPLYLLRFRNAEPRKLALLYQFYSWCTGAANGWISVAPSGAPPVKMGWEERTHGQFAFNGNDHKVTKITKEKQRHEQERTHGTKGVPWLPTTGNSGRRVPEAAVYWGGRFGRAAQCSPNARRFMHCFFHISFIIYSYSVNEWGVILGKM